MTLKVQRPHVVNVLLLTLIRGNERILQRTNKTIIYNLVGFSLRLWVSDFDPGNKSMTGFYYHTETWAHGRFLVEPSFEKHRVTSTCRLSVC